MTEQKTIYIITDGEYSDYSIIAPCATEEDAKKYIQKFDLKHATIEEHKLIDENFYEFVTDKIHYTVYMDKHGNSEVHVNKYEFSKIETEYVFYNRSMIYNEKDFGIMVNCWANSEEHAVKIANEIRTRLIASGEWEK